MEVPNRGGWPGSEEAYHPVAVIVRPLACSSAKSLESVSQITCDSSICHYRSFARFVSPDYRNQGQSAEQPKNDALRWETGKADAPVWVASLIRT